MPISGNGIYDLEQERFGFRTFEAKVNDKGEKIDETLFVSDKYELFDIKEERKEKIIKISNDELS